MLRSLRPHLAGIALMLVLAAALAGPRWWLLATEPSEGERVQVSPGGAYGIGWDEALYVPIIRQAYEGDILPGDAYVVEHSDDPPLTFSWWPTLIGITGRAIGDLFVAFALVHTLAVSAALLLLYALAWRITGSRLAAAASAPIAMLAAQVLYQAQGFLALRNWDVVEPLVTLNPPGEFHTWFRFLAPSIALPVAFAAMLALKTAVEERRRPWQVASVVLIALLIYTNPFYWTAFVAALGLWCLLLALRRDWTLARDVFCMTAGSVVLAAPELGIVLWNAVEIPRSVQTRAGLGSPGIETQFASIIVQRMLFVAPFALLVWRGPAINRLWIALAITPLALAATSGLVPQVDHYLYQAWLPFSLPLILTGAREVWTRVGERMRPVAVAVLVGVAVAATAYTFAFQVRATDDLAPDYAVRSDEAAVLRWIRDNLDTDDVVVTPSRSTNYLLTALTPVHVYVPYGSSAVGTRAGDDEIMDRYFRASAAFGYSIEDTMYRLDPENGIPRPERDDITGAEIEPYVERSMIDYLLNELVGRPDEIRDRLPQWERQFTALRAEAAVLAPYRAGYLYCGPRERLWAGDGDLPPVSGMWVDAVIETPTTTLYRLVEHGAPGADAFLGCSAPSNTRSRNAADSQMLLLRATLQPVQ